jgi:prolyl-tRNA synthetase
VFARLGLGDRTYPTYASGGIFSPFSEEFQTITDAGEDIIYVHEGKKIAVNKEVYNDETLKALGLTKEELVEKKAVEVGNIFSLGTRFSEPLGLTYTDAEGNKKPVIMGCYGIGPTRVMGTIVEALADDKGMVWPEEVAPFRFHLLSLMPDDAKLSGSADELYDALKKKGATVLYDDRDARAGEKFADADLIGIPWRIIIGKETAASGNVELVHRATGEKKIVTREEVLSM